ncbi:hypothetical protein [Natranaerobius thermophilus]|uniref:Uncharacterized protein n=1 Tax=Natranaerobius thermophilus (strain ATCC BAA-1301 / DSM 18059 / JW/NM-WN-LF) TaxID=457570 RepID=B2A2Q2_NATTJ|nr:hypothetical protein [Natranaerobius thermophilus]ACB86270.1 hypothetical protein Nther_2717 [Natranaerobius thermophilus JW/NM-WN-LF]
MRASNRHECQGSEPIFDLNIVRSIKNDLLQKGEFKAYLLFKLGTSTPLTLEQLLKLRVKDLTSDEVKLYLSPSFPREINDFLQSQPENQELFSHKEFQAVKDRAVTHGVIDFDQETMRKTFGYHYFQKTRDIRKVEQALNMKPETFTFKYIGYYDETYYCFYCTKGCLW